ncbi:hypothetical protein HMSSN036_60240 [Paenibacillus macerans]|nr:hypothetical protein HMSSN036_60240 [Paenibacillus macerans]
MKNKMEAKLVVERGRGPGAGRLRRKQSKRGERRESSGRKPKHGKTGGTASFKLDHRQRAADRRLREIL